jgi:hypothetical protein
MTRVLSGGQVGIGKLGGDGLTRLKVAVVGLGEGGIIVGVVVVSCCMVVVASWDILV